MLGMLWTTESSLESALQMKLHGGFIWKTLEWLGCIVANRGRKLVPWDDIDLVWSREQC